MYKIASKVQTSFKAGYSPRSSLRLLMTQQKQLLNKISLGLDRFILSSLKSGFTEEGLSQIQFIQTFLKGIEGLYSEMSERHLRLVNAIHNIYQDITMGADQSITWEMFSNYLINNVRHVKNKQEIPYTFSKSNLRPKIKFENPIARCIYVQSLNLVMMCEQNSNKVHVMDPIKGILLQECLENQPKKLTVETSIIKKQRGKTMISTKQLIIPTDIIALDILYISDIKFNVLLCSTSDGSVKGWNFNLGGFVPAVQPESQNLNIQHNFGVSIYSMAWDSTNQVLYCGSEKGVIYAWPFKTDTQHPLEGGHQSIVMCMCYITKLQILGSGGMDGKLILWDIVTNTKKTFNIHNRGILTMAVSQQFLLFTGGFDHQICVWNPYISGLIHKINIHASTVLSMAITSNYLFSLDAQNQIKITNIKSFQSIFTISNNIDEQKSKHKYNCLALIHNPTRIVTCSNKIQFFDYDQDKNADLSDNIPIFTTFYLEDTFKLYACTVERIKVWNMLTGELEETFSGLSHYQLSCVVFSPQKHYILIGDVSGEVGMMNIKSCSKIKQLPKQPAAVDFIIEIPPIKEHNLLAIISGYSIVNIYKVIPEGYQLSKTFQVSKNTQITAAVYHQSIKKLIIGNNFGSIQLYDVENGKMSCSSMPLEMYSNVAAIQVIEINGQHFILQASYMGSVSIILKLPQKLERVYSGKVYDVDNKSQFYRINTVAWNRKSVYYLADEKGSVVACNFGPVLNEISTSLNFLSLKKGVQILWRVKGHPQTVIHMQYVSKQKMLITSGYDKKIKIWNAETGELIDSCRQQMYHNQTAIPSFYWRVDKDQKYDVRKSQITQFANLKTNAISPTEEDLVFNPSWLLDYINPKDVNEVSNKFWKVQIQFNQILKQKKQKCLQLVRQLAKRKKSTKFQLILKQPTTPKPYSIVRQTAKQQTPKHMRQISQVSQQFKSYNQKHQLPLLQRPPKLDLLSRAEQSAHKKFSKDIALIDNQLKHQSYRNNSKTHFSLTNRKSTILSSYTSREKLSKEYGAKNSNSSKGLLEKSKLINLSSQEMNALNRLSMALRSIDGGQMKYEESVRIRKKR